MSANYPIFLIGFMGSGKSYVGRRLAQRKQLPFIDLDEYLEDKLGTSISDFFAREGEAAFRKEESKALREMDQQTPRIIACGGGTPCQDDNMDWMNNHGTTVFIDTPETILVDRLQKESAHRPLIAQQKDLAAYLSRKLAARRPVYEQADIVVTIKEATTDVVSLLEALLFNHG